MKAMVSFAILWALFMIVPVSSFLPCNDFVRCVYKSKCSLEDRRMASLRKNFARAGVVTMTLSDAKEPEIVNFKSPDGITDPREAWNVDVPSNGGPRFGASKVPDAITMTDNSDKRLQNSQLRSRMRADANEPEALRQMRLAREQEEAAAVAEAERRSKNKEFISGQDVREQRLIDEYTRSKGSVDSSSQQQVADIRDKLKAMQGSGSRRRTDKEALLHQSQRREQSVPEVAATVMEFMNKKLAEALGVMVFTLHPVLSAEASRSNAFMNGAFQIPRGRITAIDERSITIDATVMRTGFFGNVRETTETVRLEFPRVNDTVPLGGPAVGMGASGAAAATSALAAVARGGGVVENADELKAALMAMLRACGRAEDTAVVLSMPSVGSMGWGIPDNLFLNEVPSEAEIREWFYRDACDAVQLALDDPALLEAAAGRLRIECVPPELNPEMDTFRVGTMLELVREIAIRISVVMGRRVKVCIQGPLGQGIFTGLPLMLSGMRKVLEGMDWQARPGEMYEGLLAQVAFGAVGPEVVEDADEVFVVIAPQNMVGASVYDPLSAMLAAAAGRPVILINPRLQGAIRYNFANSRFWTVFKREASEEDGQAVERYRPLATYPAEPNVADITCLILAAGANNA